MVAIRHDNSGAIPEAAYPLQQIHGLASRRCARLADAEQGSRCGKPAHSVLLWATTATPNLPATRAHIALQESPSFTTMPLCAVSEHLHMDPPVEPSPQSCSISMHADLPVPAYFRMRDVLRITGLSRPTLYRRISARRFPPPVHLGGRACGWPCAALQNWIADPERYLAPETTSTPLQHRSRGRPRKYAV